MPADLYKEVLKRLESDYKLVPIKGTNWLRKGVCPSCHGGKSKEASLFAHAQAPWVIMCGRGKCNEQLHIKEIYKDLFEDVSKRHPATAQNPAASADAYLSFNRGFDLHLVRGWYSQESYFDRQLNQGSATVRFELPEGGYWERLIDKPSRFGKMKARFKPGWSYKGKCWVPPCVDLLEVKELWIVEGIFDAIALLHHGIAAVSMMSSAPFPGHFLQELAELRQGKEGKLPRLVWALDNEPSAHASTRKCVHRAAELGYRSSAAQIPQRSGRKLDWNELHQLRWASIDDQAKRKEKIDKDLREARHHGDLLLAESASDYGMLMYTWKERQEFPFVYEHCLYWFKLDLNKYNAAREALDGSERQEDRLLTEKQKRDKALRLAGGVVELANCAFQALYYQRNLVTDEAWYYLRIDFPHDGGTVKATFTSGQLAAAAEFKKRLLHVATGAMYTGSGGQLDHLMRKQLYGLKVVETIDYMGYSKEHQAYVFADVAVKGGQVYHANDEDFFDMGRTRLKTLQRSIKLHIETRPTHYTEAWLDRLWLCFGAKGVISLAFWLGSTLAEQIRGVHKSFPFLELTGEAGAGKSTLINLIWKMFGRPDDEGKDPSKGSAAGRRRWMGQVSNQPVVLLEADRNDPNAASNGRPKKAYDWDELKPLYNGGSLGVTGVKTAGNETYEPPFRGSIVISQNAAVSAHEAILTRLVKVLLLRPEATPASRQAAAELEQMQVEQLSHFMVKVMTKEQALMECFTKAFRGHEVVLRGVKEIRVERIIKNHAQMMALIDCLAMVCPLTQQQINECHAECISMAIERQFAISADHPGVAQFWDVYDYLESEREDGVVNHHRDDGLIAIHINEFVRLAAEHRQELPSASDLRNWLPDSSSHKYLGQRSVNSRIRERQNQHRSGFDNLKPVTVRCWVFENPNRRGNAGTP
ncbi:MAG: toprim domain-containing protein [Halothiobacillaceae bacterium]